MAGERYADRAVANLLSYFETNLGTHLDAIESAQSLTAGSMTDPVDFVPANVPDDNRSPLFMCYVESGESEAPAVTGVQDIIYVYDCVIAVEYSSDADIEAGQLFMRRYMTALIDCLKTSRTLSDTVTSVLDTSQEFQTETPGTGQTRYRIEMNVEVTIHETT